MSTEIFELFLTGMTDKTSNMAVMSFDRYFDRNILGIIRDYLFKGFSIENIKHPTDVAFIPEKNQIFVIDRHALKMFDGKRLEAVIGSNGSGQMEFDTPITMTVRLSCVYIADPHNARIQVVTFAGKFVSEFGKDVLKLPSAIAYDRKSDLIFVFDSYAHAVFAFSDGVIRFRFGSHGDDDEQFNTPHYLCVDSVAEELFVADSGNHRISVFSTRDGKFLRKFGSEGKRAGEFQYPVGIALHPSRPEIAVADTYNHRLQVLDRQTGAFLRSFGCHGQDLGQFKYPLRVSAGKRGTIYVCDSWNDRVQCLYKFW